MNIYDYAKKNNADYYDPHTGYIFKVQDYNACVNFGLPTKGIAVYDSEDKFVGYARKDKE